MPGVIVTELSRHMPVELKKQFGMLNQDGSISNDPKFKTPEQGAATTIYACVAPELENRGGLYLNDCHICRTGDAGEIMAHMMTCNFPDVVADFAVDEAAADRLWKITEQSIA